MKRLIVYLLISFVIYNFFVGSVKAQDVETCVQVTQYGGGVGIVCGARHEAVDTGLADINPLVLSFLFFGLSGFGVYSYRKQLRKEIRFIEAGGGENNG